MPLVAGVDSSTQSCKVVVRDASTGALIRTGRAAHPAGTEVSPSAWQGALQQAITSAGGLDDVAALSVAGQQHGMVALDETGDVVRPALLWNDTRSAASAAALVEELGGGQAWADAVGVVPVASITISKLRWLAEHEPANAALTAAVCLPHDWLTWRLLGGAGLEKLRTDRGDASGTGYWSAATGYRPELLSLALGHAPAVPEVLGPCELAGSTPNGVLLGPGTGDNAAAALALDATSGDVIISLGTSGVACAVSDNSSHDGTGTVAGFADATGRFLPLACTLNAAQVLDATAQVLGVTLDELSDLALSAPAGAGGAVLIPYLQGERTPNRPLATGAVHGLTLGTTTPAHLARATVEGMLCGLADAVDAIVAQGIPVRRALLIGGGAQSEAVRRIAPAILGLPVVVPAVSEYVADGAARQAAWVLSGERQPPTWASRQEATYEAEPAPEVRQRYAEARELVLERQP
ncbi:MAG: xylulokinase [Mycobacteriales bacterium]